LKETSCKPERVLASYLLMTNEEIREKIGAVLEPFVPPGSVGLGAVPYPLLDTSKPNIHDNKEEFLAEKSAVEGAIQNARALIGLFYAKVDDDADDQLAKISKRIGALVDKATRDRTKNQKAENASDLIRKNANEISTTFAVLFLLSDTVRELNTILQELQDQERFFWSGKSRPPNYYARTIALRVARLVARHSGKYPTNGKSREGNHPSTDFGRSLEEIFNILGIKAHFLGPGKWAVGQLTDEDLVQPFNALAGLGKASEGKNSKRTSELCAIYDDYQKGGDQ
jgi:hypothetical protein